MTRPPNLLTFASQFLAPLREALEGPDEFKSLLRSLGYHTRHLDTSMAAVEEILTFGDSLVRFEELANKDKLTAAELDDAVAIVKDVIDVINAITKLQSIAVQARGRLASPAFWREFGDRLLSHLIIEYLRWHQPPCYGIGRLVGLIEALEIEDGLTTTRVELVNWAQFAALVENPAEAISTHYGWGAQLDIDKAVRNISAAASALGIRVKVAGWLGGPATFGGDEESPIVPRRALRVPLYQGLSGDAGPYIDFGLLLAAGPPSDEAAGSPDALALTSYGSLSAGLGRIDIRDDLRLEVSASLTADHAVTVVLAPGSVSLDTDEPDLQARAALAYQPSPVEDVNSDRPEPLVRLGGVELEATATGDVSAPELALALRTLRGEQDHGIDITIAPPAKPRFFRTLLGDGMTGGLDLEAVWSNKTGFALNGTGGLYAESFPEPTGKPVQVQRIAIGVEGRNGGVSLFTEVDASAELGPMGIGVEGLGVEGYLRPAPDGDGNLGPMDVGVLTRGPTGAGFALENPVISGLGHLGRDDTVYFGIASLAIAEKIGIDAFALLDVGDGDEGGSWSFLASLALSAGPLPLPYGFSLFGVGGLIGLNRGFEPKALAAGLSDGALDAILFPDVSIENLPTVRDRLASVFPAQPGQHVMGPFVRIGWGPGPTLLVDLGVLLAFPDPKIALLAQGRILLPKDAEKPIVSLQISVIGAWEARAREIWLLGSLRGSRIGPIEITGDSAFYLSYGEAPFFLLSNGGFHPDWQAPPALPGFLRSMQRAGARIEMGEAVTVALETYTALTSNSLQLGALFVIEAEADIKVTRFRILGSSEFNALVIFSPLRIEIDWKLDVAIFIGEQDAELCGATLYAAVQGPQPWFASGYAEFRFAGAKVKFPLEVGARQAAEPVPEIDILEEVLIPALSSAEAWRGRQPADGGVVRLCQGLDLEKWVLPNTAIEVSQTAVPLSQEIEKLGRARPKGGPQWCRVARAGIGGRILTIDESDDVTEEFAPAQFFDMSESERLAAPSFEHYPSGISFAADEEAVADRLIDASTGFEEDFIDPLFDPAALRRGESGVRGIADEEREKPVAPALRVADAEYAVVVDGEIMKTTTRYADALRVSRAYAGEARVVSEGPAA